MLGKSPRCSVHSIRLGAFYDLFCKWGDISKTVWLDDTGGKRTINEFELDYLATEAIPTSPKENPTQDVLSAMRFPDWVENEIREKKRQEAAINQFYKIEQDAIEAFDPYEEDNGEFDGGYYEEEVEFDEAGIPNDELDKLMYANQDIEV